MGQHTFPPYTEGASVYHDADQSCGNNAEITLAFNSERYDTDTIHDNTTNNSRLTCKTAGKYLITGGVVWEPEATGIRRLNIKLGGITVIASVLDSPVSVAGWPYSHQITTIYEMAVGNYVELLVYQFNTPAGALDIQYSAGLSPAFMMQRIG